MSFSRGSSPPRDRMRVSAPPALAGTFFPLSRLGSPSAAYHHSVSLIPKGRQIPAYPSRFSLCMWTIRASQGALVVKSPPASAGDVRDLRSIPGSGRSPGGGHGHPLQYSCLENLMDRGAWQATGRGVAKSRTRLGD